MTIARDAEGRLRRGAVPVVALVPRLQRIGELIVPLDVVHEESSARDELRGHVERVRVLLELFDESSLIPSRLVFE